MLNFLQKILKSIKVFMYIIFIAKVSAFFKNQEFAAPKDIMRFGAKVFLRSTGSRYMYKGDEI